MAGPNPISVFLSIRRARRLATPRPGGTSQVDHGAFEPILAEVERGGVDALEPLEDALRAYLDSLAGVDPDDLTRDEALAFWLNLYNAGALDLARRARGNGHDSVLDVGDGFDKTIVTIGGEDLTLSGIEHGKIRRFGDPRIHGALVCGSVSCPTLRFEPFTGSQLHAQLDDQLRHFLSSGAFVRSGGAAHLSRVFLWYGADFARPSHMPTLFPARKRRIIRGICKWLSRDDAEWLLAAKPAIKFQEYDWGLGCAVRPASSSA